MSKDRISVSILEISASYWLRRWHERFALVHGVSISPILFPELERIFYAHRRRELDEPYDLLHSTLEVPKKRNVRRDYNPVSKAVRNAGIGRT
jgi:hypothetical protein